MNKIVYVSHSRVRTSICEATGKEITKNCSYIIDVRTFKIGKVYTIKKVGYIITEIEESDQPLFKYQYRKAVPNNILSQLLYPNYRISECKEFIYVI